MPAAALAEDLPQRRDRPAQRVLLDDGAFPDRIEQRLFLEQTSGPLDHEQQRVVKLARELNRLAVRGRERALRGGQAEAAELNDRLVARHGGVSSRNFSEKYPGDGKDRPVPAAQE